MWGFRRENKNNHLIAFYDKITKNYVYGLLILLFVGCKNEKSFTKEKKQEYDIVEFGYFDNDNVKDTIKCFYKNDVKTGEPLCDCKVILKSEIKEISIPMFSGSMQINNFEKGQVETYEVNRNGDYEEIISYQLNDKFGDWFIKSITITENGEETTSKPKEIWNISRTVKK